MNTLPAVLFDLDGTLGEVFASGGPLFSGGQPEFDAERAHECATGGS